MLSPAQFRELVSGRKRGVSAALLRTLLRGAEFPYAAAVRWRNQRFDRLRAEITRVGVPVVSIGNLTLGGTGKTPLVKWLARWLRARSIRVVIISRGYKSTDNGQNDEALELEQCLPDVPHLQFADRVHAANLAIEEFESQCIVLDDGFQHRRLARDLDIVLIDALEPFGFGHVFPRGTLREPLAGLSRAGVVALSRADSIDASQREEIQSVVARFAPEAAWIECDHRPQYLLSASGRQQPLAALKQQKVAAFCGIGNPAGFRHTLAAAGLQVAAFREFPDHHGYTRADVESLAAWSAEHGAAALLCTHKDLVKLGTDQLGRAELWAVVVELEIGAGLEGLEAKLLPLVPPPLG